jgi:hypothetical protein
MFQNTLAKEGGSPAQTVPLSHSTTDDPLRFELREHVRTLRLIVSHRDRGLRAGLSSASRSWLCTARMLNSITILPLY